MGRKKQYVVNLTAEERQKLTGMTKKGKISARVMTRARSLLLSDEQLHDQVIRERLGVNKNTVANIRRKYATGGLEVALYEQERFKPAPKLDPKGTAMLIAETCSDAPDGYSKWTMQLLADRLVELRVVDSISDETVRRTLKKTRSNRGKWKAGVPAE